MVERRAGAPRLIEWTGERCVPWTPDVQVVYEHFHRYLWTAELTRGKRVLDVASGEGFGSAILADGAARVTGIDIDPTTVEHSSLNYAAPNLEYRVGSALALDGQFEAGSFDVVVVFELIEHVEDHARVLEGIRHVLAPGGLVVMSTPDRRMYSDATGQDNPFHEHELTEHELRALLGERFEQLHVFGQRAVAGSRIASLDGAADGASAFAIQLAGEEWRPAGAPAPMYLIAVASDEALPPLPQQSSLSDYGLKIVHQQLQQTALVQQRLDAAGHELAVARDQAGQWQREAERRGETRRRELDESFDRIAAQRAELDARDRELAAMAARHAADADELRRVHESIVWNAFQRVRGRLYGLLGGRESRRGRALQWSLRTAGRARGSRQEQQQPSAPSFAPIRFPSYDEPLVSLVITAYTGAEVTAACLRSIAGRTEGPAYEVIVVDDAADDDNAALWEAVEGANVIVNRPGIGYLRSTNLGVSVARGRYVVLMNNDVEVEPGWLRALFARAESAPDVGAVAPKLLYPDGRLQEAGAIIFQDGTGWNFGRNQDPGWHEFNYAREVDYGSAACLLVRREAFEAVGGYDERFLPMYYEDADLCFALRAAGLRVMYEPTARVVHHEGHSAGTDITAGGKRHQELNRPKFVEKWRDVLEHDHARPAESNVRRASNRADGPHVLVIDHRVPFHDHDAGSLRMRRLLEELLELGCRVTFAPDDGAAHEPYTSQLQSLGIDVVCGGAWLGQEIAVLGNDISLAIVSRPYVAARYTHMLREHAPTATIAYDTVDLHYVREERRAQLGEPHAAGKASTLRELELGVVRGSDVTIVVSDEERAQIEREVPGERVIVIPVVNDVARNVRPPQERRGVLFVGGFDHPPNVDAALMLVQSVMPLVRQELGDVPVTIAGARPTDAVQALAAPDVDVTGWVEQLEPLLDSARVLAAPLRYGAGMKGKVTQALGAGLPVVTTPTGAEGLAARDGHDLLIGESPEELAQRLIAALTDDELWLRLSSAGQEIVRRTASIELMRERLTELLELAR